MSDMLDKLASVEARYDETATRLADPAIQADPNEFTHAQQGAARDRGAHRARGASIAPC